MRSILHTAGLHSAGLRAAGRTCALLTAAVAVAVAADSVVLTPIRATIGINAKQQYTALVNGAAGVTAVWKVEGVAGGSKTYGTITSGGLYTAPGVVPAQDPVEITAATTSSTPGSQSVFIYLLGAGPTVSSATPSPIPVGSYSVTAHGAGFVTGAAIVIGGIELETTFVSATEVKGTGYIGAAGAQPLTVTNPGTVPSNVLSVSFGSTTKPVIAVTPSVATVQPGKTQQFNASGATGIEWAASAGIISSTGLYTAPATMPASSKVTITASATGATSGTATVTLKAASAPPPQITVTPSTEALLLGSQFQFSASGATAITWAASVGSIGSTGLYTAPSAMPASGKATITATATGALSGTATVTLTLPAPSIQSTSASSLPLGIFSVSIKGTGFLGNSAVTLNGAALLTAYVSSGQLNVSGATTQTGSQALVVSNGALHSAPFSIQVGSSSAKVSAAAARRFLQQAAFGPSPADAANVQAAGFQAWLNQQFSMPRVSGFVGISPDQGSMPQRFLTNAVMNPDQLRQRVAFALSQITVSSLQKDIWNANMIPFQTMLMDDAFTNYRQILYDVTLSGSMGEYLDMGNNAEADPAAGTVANENYAREIMQLFSLGVYLLNPDGSIQLDSSGNPIPTYNQKNVTELARVFTGWTYAPVGNAAPYWGEYYNCAAPMIPWPSEHDHGSKTLLNGYVAPAGLDPLTDLNGALDNIFQHPNIGPFISRQLIQHLVKSNPSPAYVSRVAAVFANDGSGVRGDMKAVIGAILLDSEARANDDGTNDQPTDGHLQEPALFIAGMVRAFGGQMTDGNYFATDMANMGQDIYSANSVFNYYSPGYRLPPPVGLSAPEFQINTPNNAVYRANLVGDIFSQYSNKVQSYGPGTTVDLTPYVALAANPTQLINALDLALTRGAMPSAMKTAIVNAVTADAGGNLDRAETAAYLILTSSYYNIWH